MEWILSIKHDDESTNADFTDLVQRRFESRQKHPQLSLVSQQFAKDTGFANLNLGKEMESLDVNAPDTLVNIEKLRSAYGAERLEQMSSSEFYQLYKSHNLGSKVWWW